MLRAKRSGNLLLVASIVGTILGMEIDVLSGPLLPASFSLILYELYTPDCTDQGSDVVLSLLPVQPTPGDPGPVNSGDSGETSVQRADVVWPAPLIVSPERKKEFSDSASNPAQVDGGPRITSLRRRSQGITLSATSAISPLLFCRLLC